MIVENQRRGRGMNMICLDDVGTVAQRASDETSSVQHRHYLNFDLQLYNASEDLNKGTMLKQF